MGHALPVTILVLYMALLFAVTWWSQRLGRNGGIVGTLLGPGSRRVRLRAGGGGAILSSLLPGLFSYRQGMLVTAVLFVGITLIGGFWAAGMTNVINVALIYVGLIVAAWRPRKRSPPQIEPRRGGQLPLLSRESGLLFRRRFAMAGFRLPGVLCVITNSSPIDAGTLPRATFASPGPVGAAASARLSADDLDLIQATAGKNIDGSTKPLQELEELRHSHLIRKQEASREFGARSSHVLFEQTVIDRLTVLIERAQSPLGRATEQLATLIQQAQQPGRVVPEEKLGEAIAMILGLERQRQLIGGSDADSRGSDAMALVARALNVFTERRLSVLETLVEKAKRPGSSVTNEQLSQAVASALGAERQRQLLGVSDTDSSGAKCMALVAEASNVFAERQNSALRGLLESARRPGSTVTDEQLREAVASALGAERQRQLLGISDADAGGANAMTLVLEAAKVSLERKGSALSRLYDSGASEEQIKRAVADYEDAKRQLRLLGGSAPDADVRSGPMKITPR